MWDELWSAHHEASLERLLDAVEADRVLEALYAIDCMRVEEEQATELQLDAMGAQLRGRIGDAEDPVEAASLLSRLMVETYAMHFQPDGDPGRTGSIAHVLAHQGGELVALGCVWAEVARRAGLQAELLEMEVFVAVRVEGVLLDITSGGLLTEADCRHIVSEVSDDEVYFERWFLEPARAERLVRLCLERRREVLDGPEQRAELFRMTRLYAALTEEDGMLQLELGTLAEELGARSYARNLYRALARRDAEGPAGMEALRRLERLGARGEQLLH